MLLPEHIIVWWFTLVPLSIVTVYSDQWRKRKRKDGERKFPGAAAHASRAGKFNSSTRKKQAKKLHDHVDRFKGSNYFAQRK